MYDNGDGVKKSLKKAKAYFAKACRAGSDNGCQNVKILEAR